jgi:hypothetical protein
VAVNSVINGNAVDVQWWIFMKTSSANAGKTKIAASTAAEI